MDWREARVWVLARFERMELVAVVVIEFVKVMKVVQPEKFVRKLR